MQGLLQLTQVVAAFLALIWAFAGFTFAETTSIWRMVLGVVLGGSLVTVAFSPKRYFEHHSLRLAYIGAIVFCAVVVALLSARDFAEGYVNFMAIATWAALGMLSLRVTREPNAL